MDESGVGHGEQADTQTSINSFVSTLKAVPDSSTFMTDNLLNLNRIGDKTGVPLDALKEGEILIDTLAVEKMCGYFTNAEQPGAKIDRFSYSELARGLITYSSIGCPEKKNSFAIPIKLKSARSHDAIPLELPVRIVSERRSLPKRVMLETLKTLPGTDTILTEEHLSFTDSDSKSPDLVYMIVSEAEVGTTRKLGSFRSKDGSKTQMFSQYQINLGEVVFSTDDITFTGKGDQQVIGLLLFDAGDVKKQDADTVFKAINIASNSGQLNPYAERLFYTADNVIHSSALQPIKLVIAPNQLVMDKQMENVRNELQLLVKKAPESNTLETIVPGSVGFKLSAENLYLADRSAIYRLTKSSRSICDLVHIASTRSVTEFYQDDINRRRLAIILKTNSISHKQSLMHPRPYHPDISSLPTEERLQFIVHSRMYGKQLR